MKKKIEAVEKIIRVNLLDESLSWLDKILADEEKEILNRLMPEISAQPIGLVNQYKILSQGLKKNTARSLPENALPILPGWEKVKTKEESDRLCQELGVDTLPDLIKKAYGKTGARPPLWED
jgi:hypothetical protein